MIVTTQPVKYDKRAPEKESKVYAQITSVVRNPINKTYTLKIEESIVVESTQLVDEFDEIGNVIGQNELPVSSKLIIDVKYRTMGYAEANALTDYLDQAFTITETKTERRDKYTVLGHLVINNQDQVYGASWELV